MLRGIDSKVYLRLGTLASDNREWILTPTDMFTAFAHGFAGCPSILELETKNAEYARTWRTGDARSKLFHQLKLIYLDITSQHVGQQRVYMRDMCRLYLGEGGGMISTLSRAIEKKKKLLKEQGRQVV